MSCRPCDQPHARRQRESRGGKRAARCRWGEVRDRAAARKRRLRANTPPERRGRKASERRQASARRNRKRAVGRADKADDQRRGRVPGALSRGRKDEARAARPAGRQRGGEEGKRRAADHHPKEQGGEGRGPVPKASRWAQRRAADNPAELKGEPRPERRHRGAQHAQPMRASQGSPAQLPAARQGERPQGPSGRPAGSTTPGGSGARETLPTGRPAERQGREQEPRRARQGATPARSRRKACRPGEKKGAAA